MSIKVLWVNPLAARLVSTNWVISPAYAYLGRSGVGDFRFTYGIALLAPLMVAIAAGTGRSKWLRVSMAAGACVFAYYLYLATFAMSIYMMIAGTLIAVFLHIKRLSLKFAASLLFVVASLLFVAFGADLMLFVARNVKSEVLSIKARAVASLLPGGQRSEEGQFASGRISLYGTSFKTFLEHPILGVGAYYSVAGVDVGLDQGIGGHSDLLDNLARYGLIGAVLYLPVLFLLAFRAASEGKGTAYGKSALAMWVLLFLMCCSNPVSGQSEIGVSAFLLWPALPCVFAAKGTALLDVRRKQLRVVPNPHRRKEIREGCDEMAGV
jgi:O-antigen ligase